MTEHYFCDFCQHPFKSELPLDTVKCPKCNSNEDVDLRM